MIRNAGIKLKGFVAMKILLVATVQSHICQFHRALVEMLRESDPTVEIHVAARDNLAEKNGMKLDFADRVFDVPFQRSPLNKSNTAAYRQLKEIINSGNYDIIHCNTPVGGILSRKAAKKARKNGTKVFYTAHGFHFYRGASRKNWMLYYPIEKHFSKKTDVLITINEEDYLFAKKKFRCRVERIHGVGVDSKRYSPASPEEKAALKQKLGINGTAILCVGELLPNKNQAMAVRAMPYVIKKIPDVMLLLAGNGSEKDNLEALIDELDMREHVKLLGYCLNLEEYQKMCSLSISCSIREGLGLNLIEGMLSCNPVVATKNRGHNELVKDGVNGYLVDFGDHEAMADRITEVLSDNEKYLSFSREGYKIAVGYSFDRVKKELKDIYYGK